MSRLRLAAAAVLAVVAVVAGFVAVALTTTSRSGSPGGTPAVVGTPRPTSADVAADYDATAGVVVSTGRVEQDGIARSYLVLAPPTVAPDTPLVVGLHGRNATSGAEANRDQLTPYVAAGQAVLVYPVGYDQAWNTGEGCCGLAVAQALDDVAFVGDVVDAVRARFGLTGPTDLVGFSNGGRLAFEIACRDPQRYAAVATVSAAPPAARSCASTPVPLFAGFVLDDPELPTADDPRPVAAVAAAVAATWTARDGCPSDPTTTSAAQVTVATWTSCARATVVQTATWTTGGHSWPQHVDVGSPDAADLVWSFLSGVRARAG